MKPYLVTALLFVSLVCGAVEPPLRLFTRADAKTDGPGQPDPRFLAPALAAITAERAEAGGSAPAPVLVARADAEPKARKLGLTLIVGGGTHHDFDRWFNREDTGILQASGKLAVSYTDQPEGIGALLPRLELLYLSNNKPITNALVRKAIFDFADLGRGLLLVHPALWYNWTDWPKYNQTLVGGGARSHDRYGEFEVTVTDPKHPVMKGVPATFKLKDELYHFVKDGHGATIEVLATGKSPADERVFPVVWVTKHPRARIVCITLGHDGAAHQHEAFRTLLTNAAVWAAHQDGEVPAAAAQRASVSAHLPAP